MKNIFCNLTSTAAALSLLISTACTPHSSTPTAELHQALAQGAWLAPKPNNPMSEKAQLQRFRGQTDFLNPVVPWEGCNRIDGCIDEGQASDDQAPGAREEQEADVFKIGRPGSKLIYLLNNYRGLQIVSFADGPEKPKILGRVKATGNSPQEMYFDQARERLVVLEKFWLGDEYQSRILIYDVKTPSKPRIEFIKKVEGHIADSRIVGDVLYLASTVGDKGSITSLSLTSNNLQTVETYQVPLKLSAQNSLNIQSVEKDGVTSYYMIATLSESEWGWWDRSSVVQVVDITNPKGKIHLIMSVAAKGFLSERSQTLIKNNTLIVTSNYFIAENSRIARIAVETFRFPTSESEVLTEKEALYRKLHIDREMKGQSGPEADALLEKLVSDPVLGIKGRFVQSGGSLRKMIPDSAVTVGDGNGLSANLQDVRYQDGLLYAFWVPANQIDPLDLFDISDPQAGVKYLSHLHFDGWIEKAVPLSFQGRNFVLGLGRIFPTVNNENQRRRPQAMIFEIKNLGGRFKAEDVAQYTFDGSDIWTNFNDEDKMMEVNFRDSGASAGTGEILFPASRFQANTYSDGGQILNFSLAAVVENQNAQALKPGAFLSGGSDWIRRIFTNKEINRINSFSDEALAVFNSGSVTDPGTLQPAYILELARNLRAFENFVVEGKTFGVQFISGYSWASADSSTSLRVVASDKADSEKSDVLSEMILKGNYLAHLIDQKSKDLIVLSNYYRLSGSNGPRYQSSIFATRLRVSPAGALQKIGEVSWEQGTLGQSLPLGLRIERDLVMSYESVAPLLQFQNGSIVAQVDSSLKLLNLNEGLSGQQLEFSNCQLKDRHDVQLQVFNNKPYLSSKELHSSQEYHGLEFNRNWLAPVTMSGNQASCGTSWNIPGEAILVTNSGEILSRDTFVQDIVKNTPTVDGEISFSYVATDSLISTKASEQKQSLVDEVALENSDSKVHPVNENEFVRLISPKNSSVSQLEFLKLDEKAQITTEVFGFSAEINGASLDQIFPHPTKPDHWFGLLENSTSLQVIEWSKADLRPQIKTLLPLDERMEKMAPVKLLSSPGLNSYNWGEARRAQLSLDPSTQALSFQLPLGLYGVEQFFLED